MSKKALTNIVINASILIVVYGGLFIFSLIDSRLKAYPHIPYCFKDAENLDSTLFTVADNNRTQFINTPEIMPENIMALTQFSTYRAVTSAVTALTVSSDDQFIATGHTNGAIAIYDLNTGEIKLFSHDKYAISLAINPSNTFLAAYDRDSDIVLWDIQNERQIARWNILQQNGELSFLSDHEIVYSSGIQVYLCDLTSRENTKLLDHAAMTSIANMVLSEDRLNLIFANSGDNDSTGASEVIIWNFDTQTKSSEFRLSNSSIADLSMSSNSERAASISIDGYVNIIDMQTHSLSSSFQLKNRPTSSPTYVTALNRDGRLISIGGNIWNLRNYERVETSIWNTETATLSLILPAYDMTGLIFNTTGNLMISGSADGTVTIWGIASEETD